MQSQVGLRKHHMNKASGSYGIPVQPFQILKNDAVIVLHSKCQQIWKTQQWPQDWKWSGFIQTPKKVNTKECSNYYTIALISHTSMEKAMAPHSSTLAWKIPWMEEPGGLQSMRSHRVGHDWSDLAAAAAATFNKNLFIYVELYPPFNTVDELMLMSSFQEHKT